MNTATKNLFELLQKISVDGCKGGGFQGGGSYRPLFEPIQGENTIPSLMKQLDLGPLQNEWLTVQVAPEYKIHDKMKLAMQNDLVAQFHRDMQHRYTGRISRMLQVTAKAEHQKSDIGTPAMLAATVNNFLALSKGGA